ncbi:unnamed protein product [Polarella glacialis]|uniref:Uncharacterized protein n=1 Tax=Polarella glacialis TaxID=89957 RepID=A0A813I5E6_POLGL|nr:unnamed protein product [Polarella glacialis]
MHDTMTCRSKDCRPDPHNMTYLVCCFCSCCLLYIVVSVVSLLFVWCMTVYNKQNKNNNETTKTTTKQRTNTCDYIQQTKQQQNDNNKNNNDNNTDNNNRTTTTLRQTNQPTCPTKISKNNQMTPTMTIQHVGKATQTTQHLPDKPNKQPNPQTTVTSNKISLLTVIVNSKNNSKTSNKQQ